MSSTTPASSASSMRAALTPSIQIDLAPTVFKVAIIGAGPSGLVALKTLLDDQAAFIQDQQPKRGRRSSRSSSSKSHNKSGLLQDLARRCKGVIYGSSGLEASSHDQDLDGTDEDSSAHATASSTEEDGERRPIQLSATVFESEASLGGTFRYRSYANGALVSSKFLTCFSDFRQPLAAKDHMSMDEYVAYLERYVDHFALDADPRATWRFGTTVVAVRRVPLAEASLGGEAVGVGEAEQPGQDYFGQRRRRSSSSASLGSGSSTCNGNARRRGSSSSSASAAENRRWAHEVTFRNNSTGKVETDVFTHLCVCSGLHVEPAAPAIPGLVHPLQQAQPQQVQEKDKQEDKAKMDSTASSSAAPASATASANARRSSSPDGRTSQTAPSHADLITGAGARLPSIKRRRSSPAQAYESPRLPSASAATTSGNGRAGMRVRSSSYGNTSDSNSSTASFSSGNTPRQGLSRRTSAADLGPHPSKQAGGSSASGSGSASPASTSMTSLPSPSLGGSSHGSMKSTAAPPSASYFFSAPLTEAQKRIETLHSSAYKEPSLFTGRHVLILGTGETGLDMAYEAVKARAASITLSTRDGFLSFPAVLENFQVLGVTFDGHLPIDTLIFGLFEWSMVSRLVAASRFRWWWSDRVIRWLLWGMTGTEAGCNQW